MAHERTRFKVRDDDGKLHEVVEYASTIDASHLDGNEQLSGLSQFRTADGLRLNVVDAQTFKVVSTNALLWKID